MTDFKPLSDLKDEYNTLIEIHARTYDHRQRRYLFLEIFETGQKIIYLQQLKLGL